MKQLDARAQCIIITWVIVIILYLPIACLIIREYKENAAKKQAAENANIISEMSDKSRKSLP